MKKAKLKKCIGIILAIVMVIGIIPFGTGTVFSEETKAASTDYFNGSGVSSGSTLSSWTWSSQPGIYKYNSDSAALELYNSTALTTNFYYTVSSLPAGTYTLQYSYYTGADVTIQPYINGSTAGTKTSVSLAWASMSETVVTYEFTTTSAVTNGKYGLQFVFSKSGWVHVNNIYLYSEDSSTYSYAGTYTSPVIAAYTTDTEVTYPTTITIDVVDDDTGDETTKDVDVTWTDTSAVDLTTAGEYTIYGEFTYDGETYDCDGTVTVTEILGSGTSDFTGITYNGVLVNGGDMIKGADVSSIISLENSGITFYDTEGNEEDIIKILADAGVNYIRVRVWNDPYRASATTTASKTAANSYGGGVCDVNYAVQLAERCAKYGIKYFVSFHYSDWWADPSRCIVPKAWSGYSTSELADAIAEFTTESLEAIAATGVNIGMVAVGNETTNYMAGVSGISNFATLMKSGCAAVREFDPNILIALHFTNPETWNYATSFASVLKSNDVDYDVFSTSYYPFWHGTLSNLETKLEAVANGYGKLTMITEYSYPYTLSDLDGDACTVSSLSGLTDSAFPSSASESNQYSAIQTILDYVSEIDNCVGAFYWEPAWISKYTSKSQNSTLWSTYGSGWTTKYSSEYDSANGSSSVGGSGVENQALFDMDGTPLKSITDEVFNTSWTDGYKPLLADVMAQVTTSTYTKTGSDTPYVTLRFVGNINALTYSTVGFKLEVYDSTGEIIKTIAKKSTSTVYTAIKANGTTVTPSEGYYYTFCYTYIPANQTYYFKAIPYAASYIGTADNADIYQLGYKYYKLENGELSTVDEIGA